jgi:circadian clock protein KaiC
MTLDAPPTDAAPPSIDKAPTGIAGFDDLTRGGLPRGRTTLVVGGPGAGKTIFALECLVTGARELREPGIFVAFEENSREIVGNAATFGWDLPALERDRLFFLDAHLSPTVVQSGDFDLTGILAALSAKAEELGAKRIVLDGIDVLLSVLDDRAAERREIFRLRDWLRETGLTAIITAKAGDTDRLSTERYAFMQFMVDCVVVFQNRLADRVALRSVRVMKYRGSGFAENEFPLVISPTGIEVSMFASSDLDYGTSTERVSTGVPRLDTMLDGGYYRGSSVLITGAPGTAKTTLAGAFAAAAAMRGERTVYVSFDEPASQIVRNMRSVGIDLAPHVAAGRVVMQSLRTEAQSSEEHLIALRALIRDRRPEAVVLDPVSALGKTGGQVAGVHASLRLLDFARSQGITVLCTSLGTGESAFTEATAMQISTIADTWIHLAYVVLGGERNRTLTVVKSRGMKHSNQVRELILGESGVTLADVYTAGGEVLVGTARWEREAALRAEAVRREAETTRRRRALDLAEAEIRARLTALQSELEASRMERALLEQEAVAEHREQVEGHASLRRRRKGDVDDVDDVAAGAGVEAGVRSGADGGR